jgi:uncharacterized protein (DUF885 family)
MTASSLAPASALRDTFFAAHVDAHPEEGSTLGLRRHGGRLSDPSAAARRRELARLRATLRDLDALGSIDAFDDDLRLDLDAVRRVASFHARSIERDDDASNLELAALPNAAMQHASLHARTGEDRAAVRERARAVPAFLEAHRANLARGIREGRLPAKDVARAFAERVLPGAAAATRTLEDAGDARGPASDAFLALARFVEEEIVPVAPPLARLGEAECAFRLRDVMGVEASISALLARAKEALADAHARIVQHARVSSLADARGVVRALFGARASTVDEILALYRRHVEAATRLVRDRALVPVPDDLALDLAPLPAGMADGGSLTNWPAPLLDPAGHGHALYASDPSAHVLVAAKNLAVHECIPGHYLQSVVWQRALHAQRGRAVRFLGVTDDVAMASGYFGTMISVEGWAVAMEHLMLEQGFYEGSELLFVAWCEAVRAMRVLLDLELHAGDRPKDAIVRMVADATLLDDTWAEAQVVRAHRMPLQGLTYLVGCDAILALRRRSREWMLELHEALLEKGPVPASRVRLSQGVSVA